MSTTLGALVNSVQRRLGDTSEAIWTRDEIITALRRGQDLLATKQLVFWDWTYSENLPRWFSYTQAWEQPYVAHLTNARDLGYANFTFEEERALVDDERQWSGPACFTATFELLEGFLSRAGASSDISATTELPKTLVAIARGVYDRRGIDALEAVRLSRVDSRYQITKGEVYGFIWQMDGIRTLRKVRVPAMQAETHAIDGSEWGALRSTTALCATAPTGTWGVCRRLPGHHPIGDQYFGTIRHVYEDGKNVRIEHYRRARPLPTLAEACELPDRYALYLRDYAMAEALGRNGPGQDLALSKHFRDRWDRGQARIAKRLRMVDNQRVQILGGDSVPTTERPPRPSLPWAYGSRVR